MRPLSNRTLDLIAAGCLGFTIGVVPQVVSSLKAQHASPVPEVRQLCKELMGRQVTGNVKMAGIDFAQVVEALACSVDDLDARVKALELRTEGRHLMPVEPK